VLTVTPTTLAIFFAGVAAGLVTSAAILGRKLENLRRMIFWLSEPHHWASSAPARRKAKS
jgi:hypothetical protein